MSRQLPSKTELEAFERTVLMCRTMLEEMEGGLAIPARWHGSDYSRAPHLSAMLARALSLYTEGRTDRAQRYVGFVQGAMLIKYGLGKGELIALGVHWWGIDSTWDVQGED